ncbi:MAG: ester cyclase [Chloroflexi bacterium]|nr:ester cyclase [Chloroflexota bacterium]
MADLVTLAEQFVQELWQRGNVRYAETVCAENYTDFTFPDNAEDDCMQLQDTVLGLRAAFPDLKLEVLDSFQDEDYVILRTFFVGTQRGEYDGFAPLNQVMEWESIDILHFQDDLLLERWAQSDLLAQLQAPEQAEEAAEAEADAPVKGDDFTELQLAHEHAELIGQFADIPKMLRQAVRTRGVQAGAQGEWSTSATVGHLWRCEVDVWQHRLREMADVENPVWEYWDPNQYDWETEFGATDVVALLDAFEMRRQQTCNFLRALSDEGWARRGEHRVYGVLDVAGLVRKALEHDREHLAAVSGAEL